MEQVKALYMEQPNLLKLNAKIMKVGSGEVNKKHYRWIQLDETIFHPKGGGQPSDEGSINGISVAYVHKEIHDKTKMNDFEIWHCFSGNQEFPFHVGDQVELIIDSAKRKLHSRLHTAGHMVAEAVNKHFPDLEAYQGNHYPNAAYVRFKMRNPSISYDKDQVKQKALEELRTWIDQDLPVADLIREGMRSIKITQDWSFCGGTHLSSLKEIGAINIPDISINNKEGIVTVKYELII